MRKSKYNQGDVIQFQRSRDRKPQLFVITKVYTNSCDTMYYRTAWIHICGEKETYYIGTLDDSMHVTLVARG